MWAQLGMYSGVCGDPRKGSCLLSMVINGANNGAGVGLRQGAGQVGHRSSEKPISAALPVGAGRGAHWEPGGLIPRLSKVVQGGRDRRGVLLRDLSTDTKKSRASESDYSGFAPWLSPE